MKRTIARSLIVVMALFLVIAGKFAYIQLFQAKKLQEATVAQRVRKVKEMPDRGEILDNQGRVLAMSLNAKNIAIYPNVIPNDATRENIAKLLSDVLDLPYKDVLKKEETKDKKRNIVQWESIANRVDPEKAQKLKDSKYSGYIEISNAPKRYYPNGGLGSTFLGYVNYLGEPGAGIEMSLNHYLAGIPGYTVAEFDKSQQQIPIGFQTASEPVPGEQVTTTIDSYIQYTLEQVVQKAAQTMKPKAIHTVVMDPNTGKILGMASWPNYNPNNFATANQNAINMNPASYVYEPGSTFKPEYMAMALDGGYINANSHWYDGTGSIKVDGATIRNFDGVGLGNASLQDIIVHSSNVGMVHISQTMTAKQALDGIKKMFGTKTGIELPNEEVGIIPSLNRLNNDPQEKATISFGQGISVTPVQLITAFSEVINGGYKIQPSLLESVKDQYGNTQYQWQPLSQQRVHKATTVELMKSYLKANYEIGSGATVKIDGYDGGAKTGSAWVVDPATGKYKPNVIVGSFMGFIPFDHPKYVMLAIVDEPTGIGFGAQSGGPIFHDAMTEILRYEGEEKTKPLNGQKTIQKSVQITVPNEVNQLFEVAKKNIEKTVKGKVTVNQVGSGEVVIEQDYTYTNSRLVVNLKTDNITGKDATNIPDLTGQSGNEMEQLFKKYKIKIIKHGTGKIFEQDTPPGQYNQNMNQITVWSK